MASLSLSSSPVCLSNILYPRPRPLRRHRRSHQVRPPPNVPRTTVITSVDHVSLISSHQASSFPSDLDTAETRDAAEGGFPNPTSYYHGRPGWPRLALIQEMADLDHRRETLRRSHEQQQQQQQHQHGSSSVLAAVVPLNLSDNSRQREMIGRLMEQYSSTVEFSTHVCAKAA